VLDRVLERVFAGDVGGVGGERHGLSPGKLAKSRMLCDSRLSLQWRNALS
jgi:hypothetical protein